MRFFYIFLLLSFTGFSQIKIEGFSSADYSIVESSLSLIKEKDPFKYSRLNEFCKIIKYSDTGESRTENDSIIVIPSSVFEPHSTNLVACKIIHETKRLELKVKKYNYTQKKEEYSCFAYEYGFSCKLECEGWLKEQIQNSLIEHQ